MSNCNQIPWTTFAAMRRDLTVAASKPASTTGKNVNAYHHARNNSTTDRYSQNRWKT